MHRPVRLIDRLLSHTNRRAELGKRIKDEMARPSPDGLRLQTLERMRLRSKDQIGMIRIQLGAENGPNHPSAA
jgi:hypothetical protein